jgi:hypothetical protein
MNKTAVEIMKESIKVEDGQITFRTRTGRGSGCGVTIPAAQFAEFMKIMGEVQNKLTEPIIQVQTPVVQVAQVQDTNTPTE